MKTLFAFILVLTFVNCAFSQPLKGKIIVYTQLDGGERDFRLEAIDDGRKKSFFIDSIKNNSITVIAIEDSLPERWVLLKLDYGKDSAARAGRFYIKSNEVVRVYFRKFFDDVLVTGGENEFIYENRFLYFDVPGSLVKTKEYNENNLRKSYVFTPRSGYTYGRYLEFYASVLKKIKEHPDKNYVLQLLYDQRQMLPLQLIDTALTSFSERLKQTEQWAKFRNYSERERSILESGVNQNLQFQDKYGRNVEIRDILSTKDITFIDFWASWCVPCKQQIPELKELFTKVDTLKIQFVSMAIDERLFSDWNTEDKNQNFPWSSYWDVHRQLGDFLEIFYIPQGVLIDKTGKVLERFVSLSDLKIFLEKQKLYTEK